MKRAGLVWMLLACAAATAAGQETAPYPNGTSGLKAGTVPPPGHYWLMYNRFYQVERTTDASGHGAMVNGEPMRLTLDAFANVHRFIHVADIKILGAEYSWNVVLPVVNIDMRMGAFGIEDEAWKLGDFNAEPFVVEWKEERWDFGYLYGFFAPTASHDDARPAFPGKGYWTHYLGAAGTYYFDEEKTWTASFLSRYEMPGEREGEDFTAGDNFSFEWGLGKTCDEVLTAGVSGYCSWQTTDDKGADAVNPTVRDRVFAVGPEIQYFSAKYKLAYQFRYWWEFAARDRAEGQIMCFTLVKPF